MRAACALVLLALVATPGGGPARADEPHPRTARADRIVAMGRALVAAGDPGSALGYFRDAIRVDPRHAEAYAELGSVYLDRGSIADALEVLALGLRARPHHRRLVMLRARALRAHGDTPGALEALRDLVRRNPEDVTAHEERARVAREVGAFADSLASYRAIVDLAAGGHGVTSEEREEARRFVAALSRLLGTLDPVGAGCTRTSRVRRALAGCLVR